MARNRKEPFRTWLGEYFLRLNGLIKRFPFHMHADIYDALAEWIVKTLKTNDQHQLDGLEADSQAELELLRKYLAFRKRTRREFPSKYIDFVADTHIYANPEGALIERQDAEQVKTFLKQVKREVRKLPSDLRIPFRMRCIEQAPKSVRQIATLLKIDEETVQKHIQEARLRIHDALMIGVLEGKAIDRLKRAVSNAVMSLRGLSVPTTR